MTGIKKIKLALKHFFSGRSLEKNYECDSDNYVAAGDPMRAEWPETVMQERPTGIRQFIVAGNSMLPKGVASGDLLHCQPFHKEDEIVKDTLLIIKVDQSLYEGEEKWLKYNYKLRSAIAEIPSSTDFSVLYRIVSEIEDSVLLPENKKELESKYKRAVAHYPDTTLVVSVTYKNGRIHYSFHPKDLIEFIGKRI